MSSSVVSTPLPNISPNQAQQLPSLVRNGNPLLQTLFKSKSNEPANTVVFQNPLAAIGLQSVTNSRESLISQAREQELIEEQRQKDLLLDQKSEKERLVIEALIQQGIIQGPKAPDLAVPTFIPTTRTTPPSVPTTRRTTTEAILPDLRLLREEEKSSGDDSERSNNANDCNDEFEVEIILDMTRELVEAKRQEKIELEAAETEQSELVEEGEAPVSGSLEAIMGARAAVTRVMEAGSERNSPATWAAVKILSDFVDSQDPGLPTAVLESIIHLTEFLNMKLEDKKEEGLPRSEKNQLPLKSAATSVSSTLRSLGPTLSPTQMRIREQILKQKLLKQKKLKEIFMEKGSITPRIEAPRVKITMKNSFPARIDFRTEAENGKQLPFSTLPIY